MTETTFNFKDIETGENLNPDSVFAADEDGIIVYQGDNSFKYIPADRIESVVANTEIGYQKPEKPELKAPIIDRDFMITMPFNADSILGRKYAYLFGLKSIAATKSTASKASAFLSKEIEIGSCSYIELSAKQKTATALIEYSIIENGKETPIVPAESEGQIEEQLFSGCPLRFPRDENKTYTILEDGKKTSIGIGKINSLDYEKHTYSIKYTPVKSAHQYYPDSNKIQIKTVQRCINNTKPGAIEAITILKHGGKGKWNI